MNTDERGYFDALTERVMGAVFERRDAQWVLIVASERPPGF